MDQETTRHAANSSIWRNAAALFVAGIWMLTLSNVLARYFSLPGLPVLADLQHYLIFAGVLFSILYAFRNDRHVRLSVWSDTQRDRTWRAHRRIWLVLAVFVPFAVIFVITVPQVLDAWKIMEGSREQAGLPGYFIVKTFLPAFCLGMMLLSVRKIIETPGQG